MRTRPILSWLAVIAIAAGASVGLVACGGDDDGGTVTEATTTPSETPTGGAGSGGGQETTGGAGAGGALSAQVSDGEQVYASSCAMCHGDQGQGGNAPALIGSGTLESYPTGRDLYDFISQNMPASDPGSLSDKQYLDVTAYLLDQHDASGSEALTLNNLQQAQLGGGG